MKKVSVVMVTYNPKIENLLENINSFIDDVYKLIIINNSSYSLNEILKFDTNKIEIIDLFENLGIAKAQNIGMKKAFEENIDFILQMDQDSRFEKNGVLKLLSSFELLLKNDIKVGILGPSIDSYENFNKPLKIQNLKRGDKKNIFCDNKIYIKTKAVISSGSLISREVYNKIGEMMEELFIDYVDTEYCWRIIKYKFLVIQDLQVRLFHGLGQGSIKYKGKNYIVSAPIRNYYQTRNEFYLLKCSYAPLNWKRDAIKRIFKRIFIFEKIMPEGSLRKKYIRKGIKDFLRSRMGKIECE